MRESPLRSAMASRTVQAVFAFLLGVALTVLLVGRPEWAALLWTAEAAGWAAGLGALLAVISALYISNRETRVLLRMRAEDRTREEVQMADRAAALALAFDHEFFQLGYLLKTRMESISAQLWGEDVRKDIAALCDFNPTDSLPMLTRFAGELACFGRDQSAQLLSVLAGYQTLVERFETDITKRLNWTDDDDLKETVAQHGKALEVLVAQIREARVFTMQRVAPIRKDLPASDF